MSTIVNTLKARAATRHYLDTRKGTVMANYQEQIERLNSMKERNEKAETEHKLSGEQIEIWRITLRNMGIPLAMSMPESMVQRFRDAIQKRINAEFPNP